MRLLLVASLAIFTGCGSSSDPGAALCMGVTGNCKGLPSTATESDVQAAFVTATDNTTIVFGAGTFKMTNGINCAASSNLHVQGAGIDKTLLDFSGQQSGSQGIYCNRDGFLIQDLTVQDTFGDAIKIEGANGVTFRRVGVNWTNDADPQNHGAYGIYPVQCKNVLIEDCVAQGASDSGLYIGQSDTIIVRGNTAKKNVAGIEIENSHNAEVYNNTATDNTAGILIFALPNLQVTTCQNVLVHDNMSFSNNRANFAAPGNIVGKVPAGTGMLVMAADTVEVKNNMVSDNNTAQAAIISFYLAQEMFDPKIYYPYPSNVWMHDNTFSGGGTMPDQANQLGVVLKRTFPNGTPTMLYDGIVDSTKMGGMAGNPMNICYSGFGQTTFADVHGDQFDMTTLTWTNVSTDITPFSCMLTPVPPVTIPGA